MFLKPSNLNRGKLKGERGNKGNSLVKFSRVQVYSNIRILQKKKDLLRNYNFPALPTDLWE